LAPITERLNAIVERQAQLERKVRRPVELTLVDNQRPLLAIAPLVERLAAVEAELQALRGMAEARLTVVEADALAANSKTEEHELTFSLIRRAWGKLTARLGALEKGRNNG
jgi:hypothetical protein